MRAGPPQKRSIQLLAVTFVSALVSACSSGTGSDDGAVRTAYEARACPATSSTPAFSLAGSAPGTILIAASAGAPAFEAFVQFEHAGDPPIVGGRLTVTDAISLRPGAGAQTFAAALPALRAGTTYSVTLQVMQNTNLAPECQKSLAVPLGAFTSR